MEEEKKREVGGGEEPTVSNTLRTTVPVSFCDFHVTKNKIVLYSPTGLLYVRRRGPSSGRHHCYYVCNLMNAIKTWSLKFASENLEIDYYVAQSHPRVLPEFFSETFIVLDELKTEVISASMRQSGLWSAFTIQHLIRSIQNAREPRNSQHG
jgi:hypothetical protein